MELSLCVRVMLLLVRARAVFAVLALGVVAVATFFVWQARRTVLSVEGHSSIEAISALLGRLKRLLKTSQIVLGVSILVAGVLATELLVSEVLTAWQQEIATREVRARPWRGHLLADNFLGYNLGIGAERGFLALERPIFSEDAEAKREVVVVKVWEYSPAERAGLEEGDIIEELYWEGHWERATLQGLYQRLVSISEHRLRINRAGNRLEIKLPPPALP